VAGKHRLSRILGLAIGLPLFAAAVYLVFFVKFSFEEEAPESPIRPLKIMDVGPPQRIITSRYPGKVKAYQEVPLSFRVQGQIIEFPVTKGQEVREGDVLAKLDPRDYEDDVATWEAQYKRRKVIYDRVAQAAKTGAVSGTDVSNAEADLEIAEAQLRTARKALDDTVLTAPFSGVVANKFVENYEDVRAKQAVLSLQDVRGNIDIEANVPESRIVTGSWSAATTPRRESQLVATFDYLPGREFPVTIKEFVLEADDETQTYPVTVTMPQPTDVIILPGMTAMVTEHWRRDAAEGEEGIITVPIEAVVVDVPLGAHDTEHRRIDAGQYYVWTVSGEDGGVLVVNRRDVEVAGMTGDSVSVVKGLEEGDRIAAAGVNFLQVGQKVTRYVPKAEGGES
jgi:RND family efflux transporter MFP subunit